MIVTTRPCFPENGIDEGPKVVLGESVAILRRQRRRKAIGRLAEGWAKRRLASCRRAWKTLA